MDLTVPYLTIHQLADRWQVHVSFIRRRIRRKEMPVLRMGQKVVLIPTDFIKEMEEENTHARTSRAAN